VDNDVSRDERVCAGTNFYDDEEGRELDSEKDYR
jgi:hypothetical protein